MTLNLEAIKARCEKATAGHTCTETPYGCLRCESETDSLDAECLLLVAEVERMRKVVDDAVSALRYIEHGHGRLYGVGWDRVYNAHAAIDAAEGTA